PGDISPPWKSVGDVICLISSRTDGGTVKIVGAGAYGVGIYETLPQTCFYSDPNYPGHCAFCLEGCQATYTGEVAKCPSFVTGAGCRACQDAARTGRSNCIEGCKQGL